MSRSRTLLVLVLAVAALAGCAAPAPTPPTAAPGSLPAEDGGCVTPAERAAILEGADAYLGDVATRAFNLRMDGTVKGERVSLLVSLDPAAERARITQRLPGGEVWDTRVEGSEYSAQMRNDTWYGRNFDEGAMYRGIELAAKALLEDDAPDLPADRDDDDFVATCTDVDGVAAVTFVYEKDGVEETRVIERASPHRPLSATLVDPVADDRFRVTLSYEVAPVAVKTELPRTGAYLVFDVDEIVPDEGAGSAGLYLLGTIHEKTHWTPLRDLSFHVVGEDGVVPLARRMLEPGLHDLGAEGTFELWDVDGNGLLSAGDAFEVDLAPGLDIVFYDEWARAPTRTEAVADAAPADDDAAVGRPSSASVA